MAKRLWWESNPLGTALQAAALPSGSSAKSFSVLARSRTWSSTFAGSRAIRNTPRTCFIQRPAEESNPGIVRSMVGQFRGLPCDPAHPQGLLSKCLDQDSDLDLDLRRVPCDPLHHRDVFNKHPDLESNQRAPPRSGGQGFRKALCDPLHHRDKHTRADDWSCTSIKRFTGPSPFSIEPRRQ